MAIVVELYPPGLKGVDQTDCQLADSYGSIWLREGMKGDPPPVLFGP